MIIGKKVHACSKCHSKAVIKNGKNTCGNQQCHCKICGAWRTWTSWSLHGG